MGYALLISELAASISGNYVPLHVYEGFDPMTLHDRCCLCSIQYDGIQAWALLQELLVFNVQCGGSKNKSI